MSAVATTIAAVIIAAAYWAVAAEVAGRRKMSIGAVPALLIVLVGSAAAAAAALGVAVASIAALAGVAVAAWVDARTGLIFDRFSLAFAGVSATLSIAYGSAVDGVIGAASIGGALFLLHALTRGNGLGFGDVKLGAILGFALGTLAGFTAIGLAFIFGACYGSALLLARRANAGTAVRFGPFIAAGTYATILVPAMAHR
jgi:leader peptidase (prepilin peptidase)/N-methyltransferase